MPVMEPSGPENMKLPSQDSSRSRRSRRLPPKPASASARCAAGLRDRSFASDSSRRSARFWMVLCALSRVDARLRQNPCGAFAGEKSLPAASQVGAARSLLEFSMKAVELMEVRERLEKLEQAAQQQE